MDKRIIKTRTAVFNAMINLLTEKEAKKITVIELCNEAGINKSTFYLHFKSINECLEFCFETVTQGIVKFSNHIDYYKVSEAPEPYILRLLDEVEKQLEYLKKFKDSDFSGPAMKVLKEKVVNAIVCNNHFNYDDNYQEIISIIYTVAGCIDATLLPLPEFNKPALAKAICKEIKKID